MPKSKGSTSNKVSESYKQNKALRKYDYLIKKITFMMNTEEYITNEKDYHILQMLNNEKVIIGL